MDALPTAGELFTTNQVSALFPEGNLLRLYLLTLWGDV